MGSDSTKLVNDDRATQHNPVTKLYMATQADIIRKNHFITHLTVMGDVCICHKVST